MYGTVLLHSKGTVLLESVLLEHGGQTPNVWGQFSWNAGDSPLGKGICVGDSSLRMQGDRPLMYGDSSFIFKGDSSLETRDNVFHI